MNVKYNTVSHYVGPDGVILPQDSMVLHSTWSEHKQAYFVVFLIPGDDAE